MPDLGTGIETTSGNKTATGQAQELRLGNGMETCAAWRLASLHLFSNSNINAPEPKHSQGSP